MAAALVDSFEEELANGSALFTGLPSTGMTEAIDKRTDDTSNDVIDG